MGTALTATGSVLDEADVIVAGAGPAGAVAAMLLAQAGRRVVLCDRRDFPRDKACGDGLIADSIELLTRLDLLPSVLRMAQPASRLLTISPGGVEVAFDSTFYVVPRLAFDHFLFERAVAAGAVFRRAIVEGPLKDGRKVVGVAARDPGTEARVELRAPLTLLATGAAADVLRAFDDKARVSPSGFAVRTYGRLESGAPLSDLVISLERDLLPGYAWAFPAPGGLVNIGVGALTNKGLGAAGQSLRARLDALLAGRGLLGSRLGPVRATEAYRGAPLRTGLEGSTLAAPGLAVIGEAAGTTYAVSGEGIGKAMESARIVAELAIAARSKDELALAGNQYAETMRSKYASRFRAYATAQRWIAMPAMADYVARRANRSQWVHDKLAGIISERALPDRVFSARAFWRLVTRA